MKNDNNVPLTQIFIFFLCFSIYQNFKLVYNFFLLFGETWCFSLFNFYLLLYQTIYVHVVLSVSHLFYFSLLFYFLIFSLPLERIQDLSVCSIIRFFNQGSYYALTDRMCISAFFEDDRYCLQKNCPHIIVVLSLSLYHY